MTNLIRELASGLGLYSPQEITLFHSLKQAFTDTTNKTKVLAKHYISTFFREAFYGFAAPFVLLPSIHLSTKVFSIVGGGSVAKFFTKIFITYKLTLYRASINQAQDRTTPNATALISMSGNVVGLYYYTKWIGGIF